MAPRGRKRKAGLKREDAARDRMKAMGFEQRVIIKSIKDLLKVYDGNWFLIEDENYATLLNMCLEKQEEISKQLATNQNEEMAKDQNQAAAREQMAEIQNEEMAEDQNEVIAEHQEEENESEMQVVDGRDQADTVSIPSEAVMDSSPAAFHFGDASDNFAPHSVEGAENTNCGWLEDEDEDDNNDD